MTITTENDKDRRKILKIRYCISSSLAIILHFEKKLQLLFNSVSVNRINDIE